MSVSKIAPGVVGGGGAAAKVLPAEKVRDWRLTHDRLLTHKEAAHYLAVSLSWLDKSRLSGLGPTYIQLGSSIRYASADLEKYRDANRRRSTSEW